MSDDNKELNDFLSPGEYRQPITTTVQEVANRLHQRMYGEGSEHHSVHSCPCYLQAKFYLGLSGPPNLYWPDGKGGNAWDKTEAEG